MKRSFFLCVPLLLLHSCALSNSHEGPDQSGVPVDLGVQDGADQMAEGCFKGTPATEVQLLNACTDADHIDRQGRVPPSLWDGRSPLPPAP